MSPHRSQGEALDHGSTACAVHEGSEAVGSCASCGRAACLACAVPVRGRVLCRECAAREVVGVAPPPEPILVDRYPGVHGWATAILSAGFVLSLLPWERFGILTSFLSAWGGGGGVGPPLASACVGLAAGAAAARWRRASGDGRRLIWSYLLLALLAAGAVAWRLVRAPAYVSPSPIPFTVLAVALAGAALGALGLRRGPR